MKILFILSLFVGILSSAETGPSAAVCPFVGGGVCQGHFAGSACATSDIASGTCNFAPMTAGEFCFCAEIQEPVDSDPCHKIPTPKFCK